MAIFEKYSMTIYNQAAVTVHNGVYTRIAQRGKEGVPKAWIQDVHHLCIRGSNRSEIDREMKSIFTLSTEEKALKRFEDSMDKWPPNTGSSYTT